MALFDRSNLAEAVRELVEHLQLVSEKVWCRALKEPCEVATAAFS